MIRPIAEMTTAEAAGIRYFLMDIDDTLTRDGKLLAASYAALWDLRGAGCRVIPVTGRPAGWCDLIAREWPVDGVVGENGALAFWESGSGPAAAGPGAAGPRRLHRIFHPNAVRNDHPALERVRKRALKAAPGIRVAGDQFARLFDLALDFAEDEPRLTLEAAERVRAIAEEEGARAKVSSIHVNVWMGDYDKLSMAEDLLRRLGWDGDVSSVMFVGDSPNDEPMFARFPLSCGVANIRRYGSLVRRLPGFVTERECGEGFAEAAGVALGLRGGGRGGRGGGR